VTSATETVELVEEEFVLPGGSGKVSWFVRLNDGWVRAPSHPSARSEALEKRSGTVWRTRVTLELPRGHALTRVETKPLPTQKSALEHLTGGTRGPKLKTLRRSYVVGPGGALCPKADRAP
jgi:hypothetical protein